MIAILLCLAWLAGSLWAAAVIQPVCRCRALKLPYAVLRNTYMLVLVKKNFNRSSRFDVGIFCPLASLAYGLHFLFTIAGVIGIGSMVETFCHLRTPVMMSIARGYDGLWLGVVFGVVAILVFRFLAYVVTWARKREVAND